MAFSTEELLSIQDLPDFLRTEHCYNDLQHGMLVVLFRHGLKALREKRLSLATRVIDNITLYLYIHFLNEEEGLVYKTKHGLVEQDQLQAHSELHLKFLDFWSEEILSPYKNNSVSIEETLEKLSLYYNSIIDHIAEIDIPTYGDETIQKEFTRQELWRVYMTRMPMSPFMPGAFETVKMLDPNVVRLLNTSYFNPVTMEPITDLHLVRGMGPILHGASGSLRDRFVRQTHGDRNPPPSLH